MIRDILVGAKADELLDRNETSRTWTRETEQDTWRLVSDETQSLYELGMTEKGQILCEFQVWLSHKFKIFRTCQGFYRTNFKKLKNIGQK